MSTDHVRASDRAIIDHASVRASAALLLLGQLLYILVTQFHTGGEANNHSQIFAKYASSDVWKSVHVGQFLAMAVLVAGLLVFCFALDLDPTARRTAWSGGCLRDRGAGAVRGSSGDGWRRQQGSR